MPAATVGSRCRWIPGRGIAYFAVQDMAAFYMLPKEFVETGQWKLNEDTMSLGVDFGRGDDVPPQPESRGFLKAFDPLTGEEVWTVQRATPYNGGTLATAGGVVFQGDGAGQFAAFNTDDGALLWEFDTLGGADGAPMTYQVDGVQYVAMLAAGGVRNRYNDGRLLVFKLGGGQTIPVATAPDIDIPEPPPLTASAEDTEQGRGHYNRVCVWCHGMGAVGTVNADLRLMTAETHERFQANRARRPVTRQRDGVIRRCRHAGRGRTDPPVHHFANGCGAGGTSGAGGRARKLIRVGLTGAQPRERD